MVLVLPVLPVDGCEEKKGVVNGRAVKLEEDVIVWIRNPLLFSEVYSTYRVQGSSVAEI